MQVVLLSMPASPLEKPSIGLSLLKRTLEDVDIDCTVVYGNLHFAKAIDTYNYQTLCNLSTELNIIEWLFSKEAFPEFHSDEETYIARIEKIGIQASWLLALRKKVKPFLDALVEKILALEPQVIGCSSMFAQNCSSLALLRRIKRERPSIVTLMGGANVERSMGRTLHKNCDFVDYIFLGEADLLFPQGMKEIRDTGRIHPRQHILTPQDRKEAYEHCQLCSARVMDMSLVGTPDYQDYFQQLIELNMRRLVAPCLLVETSRGCWWGEHRPCSFCSLNGSGNHYRSKKAERTLEELASLTTTYGIENYQVVDNIIGKEQLHHVLPVLGNKKEQGYQLIYEVKPILRKEEIDNLVGGGVHWVQAGIENLSTHLLIGLNKGTTPIENIRFLRDALESGLSVLWNYMIGMPKTRQEDIDEVVKILPLLAHLQPPFLAPLRYDRFSDYFNRQSYYGIHLVPYWTYAYVYPFQEQDREDFAFFFENHSSHAVIDYGPLLEGIDQWNNGFFEAYYKRYTKDSTPILEYCQVGESLVIEDTRPCRAQDSHELTGTKKWVYEQCMRPCRIQDIIKEKPNQDIQGALTELQKMKLILEVEGVCLGLAVKKNRKPLPHRSTFPGGKVRYVEPNEYTSLFQVE